MSEYIKHILHKIENKELSANDAYDILYPKNKKKILSGSILGNPNKCWYCGADGKINRDHFWPKSKGGRLKVYSCVSCNTQKAAKEPLQWVIYIQNKINAGIIPSEKGDRMINATLSLWDRVERKPS